MRDELVLLRGGGDLATGAVWRLWRARFPVVVCELTQPLSVRRTVSVSSAVSRGSVAVDGMPAQRAESAAEAVDLARRGIVAVLVSPGLAPITREVVVDARMAKRNIDTTLADAPLVVALGPGFHVGVDAHAVVETMRGPRLGRVLRSGTAAADTGVPGEVGGKGSERVVRAPVEGTVAWLVGIGDRVGTAQVMGQLDECTITAPFDGVVRGLIDDGTRVPAGLKIADVDPRLDVDCDEISDKALAVGGGVLEAVLAWTSTTN